MADIQLRLFASELRTRAQEILIRAASTDDLEAQGMMRVVAGGGLSDAFARQLRHSLSEALG